MTSLNYLYGPGSMGDVLDMSAFLHIQDQKTQDTEGGTFTAGAWRTRDLNTILTNTITGASLAMNQITLPAGKYYVEASAPVCGQSIRHQTRIYDTNSSALLILGEGALSAGGSDVNGTTPSKVYGIFDISSSSDIELQHYSDKTVTTFGLGIAANITTEVYSDIRIWRIGNYVS